MSTDSSANGLRMAVYRPTTSRDLVAATWVVQNILSYVSRIAMMESAKRRMARTSWTTLERLTCAQVEPSTRVTRAVMFPGRNL